LTWILQEPIWNPPKKINYFLTPLVANQFWSDISNMVINASLIKIINTDKPEKKRLREVNRAGGDEKKR
jgi:hypothetical protein